MIVIVTENAPPKLRGRLSLWLSEIRAGVYVGAYGRRERDRLWEDVKALIERGSAVMAWSTTTSESGFAFLTVGDDRRTPVLLDGFALVRFKPKRPPVFYRTPQGRSPGAGSSRPNWRGGYSTAPKPEGPT